MKSLNIKNIVIVVVILVLVHFGVGLFVSPQLGEFLVGKINQTSPAKISVEEVNVWPLTFSLSLKNIKIFDPDDTAKKIAEIKNASVHLSPLGLLSKRLVSDIKISGAHINLEGEPDGSFNIQKLARPKTSGKLTISPGVIEGAFQKKDWFAKGYDLVKKKFSSDALKKEKEQAAEAKKITKTVAVLPEGRRVHFKSKDSYLFEIKSFMITGFSFDVKNQDGQSLQVQEARFEIRDAAFDPELGFRLGKAQGAGQIKNAGGAAGSLTFAYTNNFNQTDHKAEIHFGLKEANLDALRFIYEKSLPVEIVKGTLDITSETSFEQGQIHSLNRLSLANHELKPKGSISSSDLSVPMPLLCEGLNNINPLRLEFTISGPVEKPEFKGLMSSLADLVKPNLKNVGQAIKNEVTTKGFDGLLKAVSGKKENKSQDAAPAAGTEKNSTENVVNSLESIFHKKK